MSNALKSPPQEEPRGRRWTREEYYQAAELGIFRPEERLELIGGEIIEKVSPQETPHAVAIGLVADTIREDLPHGYHLRIQTPMSIGPDSEPEPDIAVVSGQPRDYLASHPQTAALIIEIADTTIRMDRTTRASLYASAGIPEYWILNLRSRKLDVFRNPAPAEGTPFGSMYQTDLSF